MPEAELDALVRAGLRSYARYWLEAFRLPSQTREQLLDRLPSSAQYDELKARAAARATGVVLALPHAGNWDAAARLGGRQRLADGHGRRAAQAGGRVYERFVAFREKLGMEMLPLTGGERAPLDVLAERLGRGRRWRCSPTGTCPRGGVEVRFFGGRTRMPAGPALLAIRTGAPLYAVDLWFTTRRVRAVLRRIELPAPDEGPSTCGSSGHPAAGRRVRGGIAEHPQDWHMLQKLWL